MMKQTIKTILALLVLLISSTGAWAQEKAYFLDEYGIQHSINATALTSSATGKTIGGDYYVEGSVTINGTVTMNAHTLIVLCDGATLTINGGSEKGVDDNTHTLAIYAQSSGSHAGKLIVSGAAGAISCDHFAVYGGQVSVTSTGGCGIEARNITFNNSQVTVNGATKDIYVNHNTGRIFIGSGKVTANGSADNIYSENKIIIEGGQVTANSGTNGIYAKDNTTIGWTSASDFILASNYTGTVKTAAGKPFNIEGSGTLDADANVNGASVAGKTLTPSTTDPVYTITIGSVTNGTVTANKTVAFAGERIALAPTPDAGKYFYEMSCTDAGSNDVAITKVLGDYVITMPAANATVTASFGDKVARNTSTGTEYASLKNALDGIATDQTIKILTNISNEGSNTSDVGYKDVTIDLNGKTVVFGTIETMQNLTIKNGTLTIDKIYNGSTNDNYSITFDNVTATLNSIHEGVDWRALEWLAKNLVLQNGSHVTIKKYMALGGGSGPTVTILDNSWLELVECVVPCSYTTHDVIEAAFASYLQPGKTFVADGTTKNTVSFRKSWGILLGHAFGVDASAKATVTFWDGGTTTEPTADTFDPSTCTDANKITMIDNSDGNDHYIIVHIVPKDDYWTDQQVLMAMETAASLAPKRAPGVDLPRTLSLLKVDKDALGNDRHDGAGWYYYMLPKEHDLNNGYYTSMVDGFVVKKFDLYADLDNVVTQSADLKTVTISRDIDTWTAEITFDENKLKFPFDGTDKKPVITGITAKRGGIEAATVADNFDSFVVTGGQKFIGTQPVSLTAGENSWFKNSGGNNGWANIVIEVPFTVEDNSAPKGSGNNPWLITSTADMNLLAKCVNIGQFSFESMHIKLTKDLTYDATANADFLPVAVKGNGVVRWTDFAGTFDGDNHTISNLNYTHTISSPHKSRIGLFGQVTGTSDHPAAIKNLKLENCSFNGGAKDVIFGGTVAGALSYTNVSNITVTNCKVTSPLKENQPHVGGLVGDLGSGRITNCTVKGTSIACNTNEDGGSPDCARAGGIAGGNSDGEIDHCTVENCAISASYPATATKGNGVGGIIGQGYSANIHDNMVKGNTTITDVIGSADDSYVAAVIGDDGGDAGTPIYKNNYYEKSVTVSYKNSAMSEPIVLSGYTPRGYRQITFGTPTTIAFIDKTANDGAKMYVKPATISVTTTDGSTMAFDQTTVGTNVYSIEGANNYYAPGDVITLTATYKQRVDDGRTFYDLPSVNVNNDDNIAITESNKTLAGNTYTSTYTFTMPDDNATVNATITESDWFTMPTNGKKWMSLYHEWKQPTGAELQYTVTDYNDASPKAFTMKTISSVDAAKATVTSADIADGVSYCGVPTLFNCDTNLPAVLKFTPYTGTVNKPTVASQFKGTATAIAEGDLGNNIYVLNNAGEFILAYDKTGGLAAHRCYIDLGSAAGAPAVLYIDGDVTEVKEVNASLEVKDDSFYTLGGRKLNGKPTAKGIYINNGKKVVIK